MEEASEIQNHDFPKFSRNGMKTRRGGIENGLFSIFNLDFGQSSKDLTTHHHTTTLLACVNNSLLALSSHYMLLP